MTVFLAAEWTCPPDHFTCPSNKAQGRYACVHNQYVCDGQRNCILGEDEMQSCPPRTCAIDQYQCQNGLCISKVWICDHDNDCGDMSDEPSNCSKYDQL